MTSRLSLTAVMSILVFSSIPRIAVGFGGGDQFIHQEPQGVSAARRWSKWTVSALHSGSSSSKWRAGKDVAQQCAADLFALFGGRGAASAVEKYRATELLDCVRVLAPDPKAGLDFEFEDVKRRAICQNGGIGWRKRFEIKEKIANPPRAVEDLARETVEWGGDPNVILNALGPETYVVPGVEGSSEDHCTLTKFDNGRRFAKDDITDYMAFLFEAIGNLSPSAGLNVSLTRYDLFHGHMFTAYDTGRLGILFHSREYPAYSDKNFPLNLGYCQKGSTLPYDSSMSLRNIVWLAPMPNCSPAHDTFDTFDNKTCAKDWLAPGALFVLDTGEGKILDRELVPDYLDVVHTVSEDDLGDVMLDVNYFNLVNETMENRVFLC